MVELELAFGYRTDTGKVRTHNEDSIGFRQAINPEEAKTKGHLFLVADGMGGHAAGEVASRIATETILEEYYNSPLDSPDQCLKRAFERANEKIYQEASADPEKEGMGTTAVCAVFKDGETYLANVGDSRAYLLRRGKFQQLTTDHSWVEGLIRRGHLTKEQAEDHPMRGVLTRALGISPTVKIDIASQPLMEEDMFVICTDGLASVVQDEAIGYIVQDNPEPQKAAQALVDIANGGGGPDNISVIVVKVRSVACQHSV